MHEIGVIVETLSRSDHDFEMIGGKIAIERERVTRLDAVKIATNPVGFGARGSWRTKSSFFWLRPKAAVGIDMVELAVMPGLISAWASSRRTFGSHQASLRDGQYLRPML
jgi:hypothetical protein